MGYLLAVLCECLSSAIVLSLYRCAFLALSTMKFVISLETSVEFILVIIMEESSEKITMRTKIISIHKNSNFSLIIITLSKQTKLSSNFFLFLLLSSVHSPSIDLMVTKLLKHTLSCRFHIVTATTKLSPMIIALLNCF